MSAPNPYATQELAMPNEEASELRRSGLLALISVLIGFLVAAAVLSTQQNLAKMFAEFGFELSLVTSISCSRMFPLVLLVLLVLSAAISLIPRCNSIANRWNAMHIVWSILAFSLYLWGMFSPLMRMFTVINNS